MKEIRFSFDDDNNDSVSKPENDKIDRVMDSLFKNRLLKSDDVSEYLAEFDNDDEDNYDNDEKTEQDDESFEDEFSEKGNTDIEVKTESETEKKEEKTIQDDTEFENVFERINKVRNTAGKAPASRPPASRPPLDRFEKENRMKEENDDAWVNPVKIDIPEYKAEKENLTADSDEEVPESISFKDEPVPETFEEPKRAKKKVRKPKAEKNYYKDEIFDYEKSEKDREDDIPDDEDDEKDAIEYESYNVKKRTAGRKPRKRSIAKTVLVIVVLILICSGAFLASPVFSVTQIEINDTEYFSKEDICGIIGLSEGKNGVFFNKKGAEKTLESNKYIASAEIIFKMPDTMIIKINENKVVGFIPYLSSYLYIDRYGRVLDIGSEAKGSIPVIEGLKFSSFTQGQEIAVENKDSFESALVVSKAMSKFKTEGKTVRLNVSDSKNILAYIDNIKIILGDTSRIEEKIKTMNEAVKQIPEGDMGTLDLRDLNNTIIFKYST